MATQNMRVSRVLSQQPLDMGVRIILEKEKAKSPKQFSPTPALIRLTKYCHCNDVSRINLKNCKEIYLFVEQVVICYLIPSIQ